MNKYADLRHEVRNFCSDDAQSGSCKDQEQQAAFRRIVEKLDAVSAGFGFDPPSGCTLFFSA